MLRECMPEEAAQVRTWFDGLEEGLWDKVRAGAGLAVSEWGGQRHAVLASSALRDLPPELNAGSHTAGGLAIGTLDDKGFHLGLQGSLLLAAHTRAGTVSVTEHAGGLFLYGRAILGKSILRADTLLRPGAVCVVVDVRGEALGVGRVVGNLKGKWEAVQAVHDLGTYLRAQGRLTDADDADAGEG